MVAHGRERRFTELALSTLPRHPSRSLAHGRSGGTAYTNSQRLRLLRNTRFSLTHVVVLQPIAPSTAGTGVIGNCW